MICSVFGNEREPRAADDADPLFLAPDNARPATPRHIHNCPALGHTGAVPVTAELEGLIEAGLVHAVTVESGRQAWGLTIRGRSRIATGGEP